MNISLDVNVLLGIVMFMAFFVNIVVQMTKNYVPLPTKLWCILVSLTVIVGVLFVICSMGLIELSTSYIVLSLFGSFIVSFIAMYGFDTFRSLWQRFKEGENIYEDN